MERSRPVDGFRLAYERAGSGPPVVLLHGWPGDRSDYEAWCRCSRRTPRSWCRTCAASAASDKHPEPPAEAYSAAAQARSVLGLIDELGLERPVLAGYDIGSRIAQAIARDAPDRVRALVVSPPLPGAGERVLSPTRCASSGTRRSISCRWSSRCSTATARRCARTSRTSGATGRARASSPAKSGSIALADAYGEPGAMTASIDWYRAGSGTVAHVAGRDRAGAERVALPTTILWQEHDPLFPRAWSDRLDAFFSRRRVGRARRRRALHAVEAPEAFADAIRARAA